MSYTPEVLSGLIEKAKARAGERIDLIGNEVLALVQHSSLHVLHEGDRVLVTTDGEMDINEVHKAQEHLVKHFPGVQFTIIAGATAHVQHEETE